ncbi:hypothetical protein ACFPRL_22645 [Pseudoclavibacter helvolus]
MHTSETRRRPLGIAGSSRNEDALPAPLRRGKVWCERMWAGPADSRATP